MDKNNEKMDNKKLTYKTLIKEFVTAIAMATVFSTVILHFFTFTLVEGHSMDPTLANGNRLVLSKTAYKDINDIKKDDIIVINKLTTDYEYIIKRVIGLPGDKILIKDGNLYINGDLQDESYINEKMSMEGVFEYTVPDDSVFVMGDNRNNSLDSRYKSVGPISFIDITGKAIINLSEFETI